MPRVECHGIGDTKQNTQGTSPESFSFREIKITLHHVVEPFAHGALAAQVGGGGEEADEVADTAGKEVARVVQMHQLGVDVLLLHPFEIKQQFVASFQVTTVHDSLDS